MGRLPDSVAVETYGLYLLDPQPFFPKTAKPMCFPGHLEVGTTMSIATINNSIPQWRGMPASLPQASWFLERLPVVVLVLSVVFLQGFAVLFWTGILGKVTEDHAAAAPERRVLVGDEKHATRLVRRSQGRRRARPFTDRPAWVRRGAPLHP